MGPPQRGQRRAGCLDRAAKLNLLRRVAMATEQLQGLVGVVAATVGAKGLIEQGIPLGVVKADSSPARTQAAIR